MGSFDDLIPQNGSSGGSFNDLIPNTQPQNSENILQRIAASVKDSIMPQQSSNPFMQGIQSTMQGLKTAPGLGPYMQAHDAKSGLMQGIAGNPIGGAALDIVSDPESLIGLGAGGKAVGGMAENVAHPSSVFGRKLTSMAESNPGKVIDFYQPIMNAMDDPVAGQLIKKAGVMKNFGGTSLGEGGSVSQKLSNLSPQESQDLVNSLKDEVTKAVKEGTLKPKQLQVGKLFGDLSEAQNSAFDAFQGAKRDYGIGKNTQKFAKSAFQKAITGGELGAGGGLAYEVVKKLTGH